MVDGWGEPGAWAAGGDGFRYICQQYEVQVTCIMRL
jgi:hypothetical protein